MRVVVMRLWQTEAVCSLREGSAWSGTETNAGGIASRLALGAVTQVAPTVA